MKKLLIILTILALPLVAKADWQPKSSNLGLGLGASMGSSSGTPSHGPSIAMETTGHVLMETGDTILTE